MKARQHHCFQYLLGRLAAFDGERIAGLDRDLILLGKRELREC